MTFLGSHCPERHIEFGSSVFGGEPGFYLPVLVISGAVYVDRDSVIAAGEEEVDDFPDEDAPTDVVCEVLLFDPEVADLTLAELADLEYRGFDTRSVPVRDYDQDMSDLSAIMEEAAMYNLGLENS